ncbi:hypothetical protein ACWDBT_25730 [Streptomyces ardesiacus]
MARRKVMRLSGVQHQRADVARALACDVNILCADGPTENLDEDTAQGIVDTFRALARDQGTRAVAVSHSQRLAAQSDRILNLCRGRLTEQADPR